RMECAGDLGKKLFPERNESEIPTLKEIIRRLDDKTALELNDYRDTQIELITKVRTLNSRNSLLMKRTVELISGSIDSMTNAASNNTSGYDKNGNFVKVPTPAKLIDGTV
ncbi:MAG: flagellar export chaperone FlgN, partial [Candidatus Marinimicrobia bacterium]|nr:flagellar export chaperone FlgN [Candidatus Neomarinimicrobiota bacterium]